MRAEKPLVSVIIVSYNVAELLVECLSSLNQLTGDSFDLQTIVIDNASSDATVPIIFEFFPHVNLIQNQENFGFPYACNQGAAEADGDFLFFLNPDARLNPATIPLLLNFMKENPNVGVTAPQIRYPDGKIQPNRRRFPTPLLPFIESTPLERLPFFRNLPVLDRYFVRDKSGDEAQAVDWVVGAAFMVRRKVWDDLGGMDEGFFMYSEELDFCRRTKNAGWEVWYLPQAQVVHAEGQSSKQDLARRHISFNTGKVLYYRKWNGTLYADILRRYLLTIFRFQIVEELSKLVLRHKLELRKERVRAYSRVLLSKLLPRDRCYHLEHKHQEICLLTAEYEPNAGGVGDYTKVLGQYLTENNLVRVLTTAQKAMGESRFGALRVVRRVKQWNWSCLPEISRELRQRPAAVINIQYQTGAYRMHPAVNFLPLFLRWRCGAARPRVVTTFHDLLEPYLFPKAGRVRRWITYLLARTSDAVIVTNSDDYQTLQLAGVNELKLNLVPIGSNIAPLIRPSHTKRRNWRRQFGLADEDFVVGYFGLLNRNKGLDTLFSAFAQLSDIKHKKLLIIGGDTGDTDVTNKGYALELEQLLAKLGIKAHVIRTGYLDPQETSQALYSVDVGVLPFRDGGNFRRGSLLAMLAHGVPLITTSLKPISLPVNGKATNGYAESLDYPNFLDYAIMSPMTKLLHYENVILVPPDQPEAIAERLREVYGEEALRENLRYGAMKLSKAFSWERIAKSIREVYSAC
jgi:GT2 family glycosyltransferase/glycosyltransferase involved in cell wall biosynthesis